MEPRETSFLETTSLMEQNIPHSYSNDIVTDLINEKYEKEINKIKNGFDLKLNLIRRDQDIARIFSDSSSSEEGSSFSGASVEKQYSNGSDSSNSDSKDEVAVRHHKWTQLYKKVQEKMFEVDRVQAYIHHLHNDTLNTTSTSMIILSTEDLRFMKDEEEERNDWNTGQKNIFSSSLREDVALESLDFVSVRDDLAIAGGDVVINRVSFKSVKLRLNLKTRFMLVFHQGTKLNVMGITNWDKNGYIHFETPIELHLEDGTDVTMELGYEEVPEKYNIIGQCKYYLNSIKKYIGRRYEINYYTNPQKYFKTIGLCTFNILNSERENLLQCENGRKKFVRPLLEIDMTGNIQFTGATTGYLDVATKVDNSYVWIKSWCVLEGYNIKYYDDELEDALRGSFHLWKNERFKLEENISVPNHDYVILENLLAANSKEAFTKWQNKLNLVLSGKKCWKDIKDN